MFPLVCDYIANKPLTDTKLMFSDVQKHLKLLLSGHFKKYFDKGFDWILSPFVCANLICQYAEKN